MDTRHCYLAIDQGTHASRALLFDHAGEALTQHHVSLEPLVTSDRERVEYDGTLLLESVRQVIRAAQVFASKHDLVVTAAGLATQRSSVIAWDADSGEPRSPLISWQDTRGREWIERHVAPLADRVRRISGLPLTPHYGASKLRWLLRHLRDQPSCAGATSGGDMSTFRIGPLVSFLLHHIMERPTFCVDHANAGRTQLFDYRSRQWDPWLLQQFELPLIQMPKLRPNLDQFGALKSAADDSTNSIRLTAVQGDQTAALYGHGSLEEGTAVVNLGTGGFVCLPTNEPTECSSLLNGIACSTANGVDYLLEGTVNGCGAALDWAISELSITEQPFAELEMALDAIGAGAAQPYRFFNGVNGIGSPFWKPIDQRYWMDAQGNRLEPEVLRGPPSVLGVGGGSGKHRFSGSGQSGCYESSRSQTNSVACLWWRFTFQRHLPAPGKP